MEEKESSNSGSQEKTDSGSPTPISGGVGVVVMGSGPPGLGGESGGGGSEVGGMLMRGKKRGRPRKYDAEGNLNPAYLAAVARRAAAQPPVVAGQQPGGVVVPPPGFTLTVAGVGSNGGGGESGGGSGGSKRGRGKIGNNNIGAWQQLQQPLSPLGEIFANTAGGDFTPHVITVQTGEDVAAKILSFSQKGPRGICVLSANGSISNVTIRQPGSSGGLLTYEGRFEILSLTGSYTTSESGGVTSRTGGLSISLAGPDGRVVGGGVAGWLTAATPIQVVVGSFVPGGYNHKVQKRRYHRESSNTSTIPGMTETVTAANPISQVIPGGEGGPPPMPTMMAESPSEADDSIGSGHNLNVVSSHDTMEWNNGSEPSSDHRMYPDINVSVPGV